MSDQQQAHDADRDPQPKVHASQSRSAVWTYLLLRFSPGPVLLLAAIHTSLLMGMLDVVATHGLAAIGIAVGLAAQFTGALLRYRVVDEHKDAAKDAALYPSRPVPSGLISLARLRALGVAAVVVEIGGVVLAASAAGAPLAALWYVPLMAFSAWTALDRSLAARSFTLEFAVHQLAYALVALFAVAALGEWHAQGLVAIAAYLAAFVAVEVARKLEPRHDENGVPTPDTYATVWGRPAAIGVLTSVLLATGILASVAAGSWLAAAASAAGAAALVLVRRRRGIPTVVAVGTLALVAAAVQA